MGLTHKHREGNNLSVSYADSSPSRRALGISVNGARPLRFLQNSKWRALLSRVGSAMAKNLLVGVGSKARKVKALYVGVGGKARKVKKVYVGVGGKARLVYTSSIPVTGISLRIAVDGVVTATLSPNNTTTTKVTWSAKSTTNGAVITAVTSDNLTCTLSLSGSYGMAVYGTVSATADGVTAQLNVVCMYGRKWYIEKS